MVSDMHGLGVEVPSRKNLVVRRLRNVTRARAPAWAMEELSSVECERCV